MKGGEEKPQVPRNPSKVHGPRGSGVGVGIMTQSQERTFDPCCLKEEALGFAHWTHTMSMRPRCYRLCQTKQHCCAARRIRQAS